MPAVVPLFIISAIRLALVLVVILVLIVPGPMRESGSNTRDMTAVPASLPGTAPRVLSVSPRRGARSLRGGWTRTVPPGAAGPAGEQAVGGAVAAGDGAGVPAAGVPGFAGGVCSSRHVDRAGNWEAGSGEGIEDDLPLDGDESDSDDARGAGRLPWRTTRRLREGIPIYR